MEEAARQYEETAALTGDPRLQLQKAAVLLQLAQDASDSPDYRRRQQASARWADAEAALQEILREGVSPEVIREQGRLFLWLGALEPALERLERYLEQAPHDRQALLDKARCLIYLQRGAAATEVLRRLPPEKDPAPSTGGPPGSLSLSRSGFSPLPDQLSAGDEAAGGEEPPGQRFLPGRILSGATTRRAGRHPQPPVAPDVDTLFLEAALVDRNWPEAQRLAWQLYLSQFGAGQTHPRTWTAAHRRLQEDSARQELSPEVRVLIARALCRHPRLDQDQGISRVAVDLCLGNLYNRRITAPSQRRTYQASLMVLAYLLPRLQHYADLQEIMFRLPDIRERSPEAITAVNHFSGRLGRQAGKLEYLLHALRDRQERYRARSPGDLLFLADLATELGDKRAAVNYLEQAARIRPKDQRLAALRLQALTAANDAGRLLKALEDQPQNPEAALTMAQVYLQRHQYEGAQAVLSSVPREHPVWPQAQLLLIQAYRGQQDYPASLAVIQDLQDQGQGVVPLLMARAQVLEAMDDRSGVQAAYEAVISQSTDPVTAQTAKARLARFRGDWAGAYRHFATALQHSPQDIELLNELEHVRAQMRPTLAGRSLPATWRGERRPEENRRPWQFGRLDREPGILGGSRGYARSLSPVDFPWALVPETTLFQDKNHLKALETRLAGGFWLSRVLPVQLAAGYRLYQQKTTGPGPADLNLGLNQVDSQTSVNRTAWHRGELTLALGPLILGDKVKVSGELSGRRYWKKLEQQVTQFGRVFIPPFIFDTTASAALREQEGRNRLLGSFSLGFSPGPGTDLTLRYSRQDIFDQDPAIYPRLYQQVIRLDTLTLVTLDQAGLAASHQFFPGLSYQGNISQAWYADRNQRFALYQGLRWQAVNQPRMHLDVTPSYYLATYRRKHDSYFSPHSYHALGISLDFDRQIFRWPILVVQTTAQAVGNDGRWGPALATLVGVEAEPVQNLYVGLHYFFFKEWAANYWLNSLTFGLRWRF